MLLKLLIVSVEITKLVWQYIGVRNEIERSLSEFFLHPHHVIAKSIFPGDFIALREMIDLLVFVQAFVEVALAGRGAPEYVPLMRFGVAEPVELEN